jgi:MoxR-like ATPase
MERMQQQINQVLIGQQEVLQQSLVCLLAAGHLLLEGVPGEGFSLLFIPLSCDLFA